MSWPTSGENPYTLFLQKKMSLRAVGSSPEVEQPSGVVLEAAQRPIVFLRKARTFFPIIQLNYQEIALVASRYIEGHALTLCSSILSLSIPPEIEHAARDRDP